MSETLGAANTARNELKIAPAHFQAEGPSLQFQVSEPTLHLFGQVRQNGFHLVAVGDVPLKCDFLPDRFALTYRLDGSLVLRAHILVEQAATRSQQSAE